MYPESFPLCFFFLTQTVCPFAASPAMVFQESTTRRKGVARGKGVDKDAKISCLGQELCLYMILHVENQIT